MNIQHQRIFRIASVEPDRHLHVAEVHHVIGVPDDAVLLALFVADRDSACLAVFFSSEPEIVITDLQALLAVPDKARDHIFGVWRITVPFDHELHKGLTRHLVIDLQDSRKQYHKPSDPVRLSRQNE